LPGIMLIGIVLIVYLTGSLIKEGINSEKLIFPLIILVIVFSFFLWKKAVLFVMYWILVVGAVRKWLLPELSDVVFFVGHIILFGVYARFFGDRILKKQRIIPANPSNFLIFLLLLWGILSILNPNLPSFQIGILGLVVHFFISLLPL